MVATLIMFTAGRGIAQLITDGQITYVRVDSYRTWALPFRDFRFRPVYRGGRRGGADLPAFEEKRHWACISSRLVSISGHPSWSVSNR